MTTATVKAQQPTNPAAAFIKSNMQFMMVFIALAIIYVYFMFAAPNFVQVKTFTDIPLQAAYTGVMVLGATFVIATAGTDLSVGTGVTLATVMVGVFLSADWMNLPLGVGLILALLFDASVGLINGMNIPTLGPPPFIATLAMMMVVRGLALVTSDKSTISIANKDCIALSTGNLFPTVGGTTLTNVALILTLLAILVALLLSKTFSGRYVLATGSNEEVARLSGVNVRLWKIITCVVVGVFMVIGAILCSARFRFAQPAEGVGFELNVIVAAVIGGTSLPDGRASIPGALLSAFIMEILKKGPTMMGVASEWQLVVIGVVVLLVVFTDNIRQARENAV